MNNKEPWEKVYGTKAQDASINDIGGGEAIKRNDNRHRRHSGLSSTTDLN